MDKPVEFSKFYRLLNAVKEGEKGKVVELENCLDEYKESNNSESALHQLGEMFIHIGIMELYEYSESKDIEYIGSIDRDTWEDLAIEKKGDLPPHLANKMIQDAKNNKFAKQISEKWGIPRRVIEKNIMQMARYITEGIIDSLE